MMDAYTSAMRMQTGATMLNAAGVSPAIFCSSAGHRSSGGRTWKGP